MDAAMDTAKDAYAEHVAPVLSKTTDAIAEHAGKAGAFIQEHTGKVGERVGTFISEQSATASDTLSEVYSSITEGGLLDYLKSLPSASRNELIYVGLVVVLTLVLSFYFISSICRCCCSSAKTAYDAGYKLPVGTRPYQRLERARDSLSAQWRLFCRCSVKWCWIQLPIPYLKLRCVEPVPENDLEAPAVVTEVVALTVKGAWGGPMQVYLTGVDALEPREDGEATLMAAASPKKVLGQPRDGSDPDYGPHRQSWTRLHATSDLGGEEGETTVLKFAEPVRLRAGFGCRLAVQCEPRVIERPREYADDEDYVGAGTTTVPVFEHDVLVRSPNSLHREPRGYYDSDRPVLRSPRGGLSSPRVSPRASPRSANGVTHWAASDGTTGSYVEPDIPVVGPPSAGRLLSPRGHDLEEEVFDIAPLPSILDPVPAPAPVLSPRAMRRERFAPVRARNATALGLAAPAAARFDGMGPSANAARTARLHGICGNLSPAMSPLVSLDRQL